MHHVHVIVNGSFRHWTYLAANDESLSNARTRLLSIMWPISLRWSGIITARLIYSLCNFILVVSFSLSFYVCMYQWPSLHVPVTFTTCTSDLTTCGGSHQTAGHWLLVFPSILFLLDSWATYKYAYTVSYKIILRSLQLDLLYPWSADIFILRRDFQVAVRGSNSQQMVAPVSGNDVGIIRAEIKSGIREVVCCKDGDGKIGLRVRGVNKGLFVAFIHKDSPG